MARDWIANNQQLQWLGAQFQSKMPKFVSTIQAFSTQFTSALKTNCRVLRRGIKFWARYTRIATDATSLRDTLGIVGKTVDAFRDEMVLGSTDTMREHNESGTSSYRVFQEEDISLASIARRHQDVHESNNTTRVDDHW